MCGRNVGSGNRGSSQGGRRAPAGQTGLCRCRWLSGRQRRLRFRKSGESAQSPRCGQRGDGNIREQLGGVSDAWIARRRPEHGGWYGRLWTAPSSDGVGRRSSKHPVAPVETSSQRASRHRACARLYASANVVSINGSVGSLSVATSTPRSIGRAHTARIVPALSVALRTGAGSSELESMLSIRLSRHFVAAQRLSCKREPRAEATSSVVRLPKRDSGPLRPESIRRQHRAGAGRKPRAGEAALVVCGGSREDVANASRAGAAGKESRRIRRRQRRRRGTCSEAFRGRASAWKRSTEERDLHRGGSPGPAGSDGGNTDATRGNGRPAERRSGNIGRSHIAGGDRRSSTPACWGRHAAESRDARIPGQPGSRASGTQSNTAQLRDFLRRFCRDGGGNTAASDVMWVIGRVQFAAAKRRYGIGACVEAARWSW